MKNIFTLCFLLLFSTQTHGEGKLRKRFSRFLPFVAPKARKLEKNRKTQFAKMATSLSDLQLMVLDLELRGHADDIEIVDEMALMAREEIYRRIDKGEHAKILEILVSALKTRPNSILHNPVTALHFFEILQYTTRENPSSAYREVLKEFFFTNTKAIMALDPSPEQFKNLIMAIYLTDWPTTILQDALDRGKDADEFFAIFNAIAISSPGEKYPYTLQAFFTDNRDALDRLSFSTEQVERINNYVQTEKTSITFLEWGLKWAEGDANKFFEIFEAVTRTSPNDLYKHYLNEFFTNNTDTLATLPFSAEQIKQMNNYVNEIPTSLAFLEWGLKRAAGDADSFFEVFNALAVPSPRELYQDYLSKFFTDNAKAFEKLPFSTEQIKQMGNYVNKVPTLIAFLESGLKRAGGDADKFFEVFNALAVPSPNERYQDHLNKFFTDNAKAFEKLPFSTEQIKQMSNYVNTIPTTIAFLESELKRAGGDADRFFAFFHAVAPPHSSNAYRDALNTFFTDNAETLKQMPFSPEQVRHITQYVNKPSTWIILLEGGLKRAGENADEFFAIFDAIAWGSPNNDDQNALNKFFAHNAENIKKLPFSAEQVERIGRYIKRVKTAITLLEGGLMRAERNPDAFFAIFNAVATIPPNSKYRNALNKLFADNAENIGELPFSAEQVERIGRYFHISSPSSPLFDMLEGLKKNQKKKRRKKREVCTANMAILLSLGHLPENTE